MSTPSIQCPKCKATLLDGVFNQPDFTPCPLCETPLQIEVFPAFFRPVQSGSAGETILTEGEASCFYHPQKRATLACEGCGRFVCALCDCPLNGQHLCPSCLEAGQSKGRIKSLESSRMRYDNLALALAVFPILIFYLTFVTAPAALYVVFRYWKAPLGLTQGSRVRMAVAGIIAGLQVIGWISVIIVLIAR